MTPEFRAQAAAREEQFLVVDEHVLADARPLAHRARVAPADLAADAGSFLNHPEVLAASLGAMTGALSHGPRVRRACLEATATVLRNVAPFLGTGRELLVLKVGAPGTGEVADARVLSHGTQVLCARLRHHDSYSSRRGPRWRNRRSRRGTRPPPPGPCSSRAGGLVGLVGVAAVLGHIARVFLTGGHAVAGACGPTAPVLPVQASPPTQDGGPAGSVEGKSRRTATSPSTATMEGRRRSAMWVFFSLGPFGAADGEWAGR